MRLNVRLFFILAATLLPLLLLAWLMEIPSYQLSRLLLVALMTALLGSFVLARWLAHSQHAIQRQVSRVEEGQFEQLANHAIPSDFLGYSTLFNQLAASLYGRDQELQILNQELSRRLRELNALYEVSRSVNSSLDVQEVLRSILNETVNAFPRSRKAVIHLLDASGERLIPYALSNTTRRPSPSMGMPVDRGIAGYVVRKRRPVTIADTSQDPRFLELGSNVRSLMVAPLEIGDTVIGALSLDSEKELSFTQDMEVVFRSLAARAAIALENARLYSESQQRISELTTLYGSAIELSGVQRNPEAALPTRLVQRACELMDAEGVLLFLSDEEHSNSLAATSGVDGKVIQRATRLAAEVVDSGETILRPPAPIRPDGRPIPGAEPPVQESVIAVPLLWERRVLGVLVVCRSAEQARFEPSKVQLLTLFAQQAANALQNTYLIAQLQAKTAELEEANQDLSRASRLKSEFLANMSHELRTPLNSILGFSEILIDETFGEVNERQMRYLSNINRSGQHLLDLINDILDLSKIEAGRMELVREPFHLSSALQEVHTIIEPLAARKELALTLEIEDTPDRIVADRLRFKQVLYNLVSNAVKFTPDGGTVRIHAWQNGDATLHVAVEDSGIGIPPEELEQVFDVFHRIDRAYRRETEGTGLGLALVRRFMELHGGSVAVVSEEGKGSTFTVTLPLLDPTHSMEGLTDS